MSNQKEPPPILFKPTATPTTCLAEDYEQARRDEIHVRMIENGQLTGFCWCGESHVSLISKMRDIYIREGRQK